MHGELSMSNNQINNLADGVAQSDAVNVSQLTNSEMSRHPNGENVLNKYIMESVDESESDQHAIFDRTSAMSSIVMRPIHPHPRNKLVPRPFCHPKTAQGPNWSGPGATEGGIN